MGAHFKALVEGVLMAPLDSRYTQVSFNLVFVQVCQLPMFVYYSEVAILLFEAAADILISIVYGSSNPSERKINLKINCCLVKEFTIFKTPIFSSSTPFFNAW